MGKFSIRIACGQINCTVGDLEGNAARIIDYINKAYDLGVDIIAFPELVITSWPPEDLLFNASFIKDALKTLYKIAKHVSDIIAIIGFVDKDKDNLFNAAAIINQKKIKAVYHKICLSHDGIFNEMPYFASGTECPVFSLTTEHGICGFCVNIGADISCQNGPTAKQAKSGASIIFNIHSSPYHMEKFKKREKIITTAAKKSNVFIAYVNLVGGQDELVFNGQSFVASPDGKIVSKAEAFKEQLLVTDIKIETKKVKGVSDFILKPMEKPFITTFLAKPLCREAEIYEALLLGLKDYVEKNRFGKVILGISGGIDSAVVATIAVDALGKQRVVGVFMPGQYSSHRSEADARELAKNLGIELFIISIKEIFSVYLHKLRSYFKNMPFDITEENLQARIRGNLLMALSNRFGYLVLASGNKSEMSTGYATLYGDMAGGFAVIKDVSKTLVYKIAAYRNSAGGIIPKNILVKEPTAELRPGQKDSDTLPRYNILDKILNMYIEQNKDVEAIIKAGFNEDLVKKIIKMVDKNEYKRRQAPPGIKITARSLGKDRKMPITNRYHI